MSHYTTVSTQFRDASALVAALREEFEKVEVHDAPVHLYGYQGDEREQVAHVIVRRQYVGMASNDLGFVRGASGAFEAIVSEYDERSGHGKAWMDALKQRYALMVLRAKAASLGYRVVGETKDKDGSVKLLLEV